MVKKWWQPNAALVVPLSGGAMRVVGIRKKAGQATYFLRLARAEGVAGAHVRNADEAELHDASQFQQVIMGFVGGFFRTARGIRVRVVETAGTGLLVESVRVEAYAGEAGSASLGVTTHEIQQFLQDITLEPWDESAAAALAGAEDVPATFSQYPGLREVLQAAFGDPLPDQAVLEAAMGAMVEGQAATGGGFAERASALEAQVATPGGQAGLTRLRAIRESKLLPAADAPEEVGVVIRRLVFEAAEVAPVAAAAAPTVAPARRPPAPGGDDPDDSESELDEEPEIEEVEAAPQPKRRKGGTAARPHVVEAAPKLDLLQASPSDCMAFLSPPSTPKLDAARVLFEPQQLRETAGCEEVPAVVHAHQRPRLHARYDLAAQTVLSKCGRAFLEAMTGPQTLDELAILSEQIAHELRRATTTATAIAADRPELTKEGKPAEPLSAAARVCAVSADVAMRLHSNHAALLLPEAGCDGISTAPSRLRADLARAIRSNGKVDAAGEVALSRKSIPARAHVWRSQCEQKVEAAIEATARADLSGQAAFGPGTAAELAQQTLRGDIVIDTFESAGVKAFAHLGLKAGTEEALGRAVDVLEAALSALFEFLGDAEARAALAAVKHGLQPGGVGAVIAIAKRKLWVNKVFATHAAGLTRWRRAGAEPPSLAASVEACQAGLNFDVYAQLLAQQAERPPRKAAAEGGVLPKERGGRKGAGDRKAGGADHAVYAAVPSIPAGKFNDASKALAAAHPAVCRVYLLTKKGCFRGDKCKFKHEAPKDLSELVKKAVGN